MDDKELQLIVWYAAYLVGQGLDLAYPDRYADEALDAFKKKQVDIYFPVDE